MNSLDSLFNVIVELKFELAYFKAAVQHFSHYASETTPLMKWKKYP